MRPPLLLVLACLLALPVWAGESSAVQSLEQALASAPENLRLRVELGTVQLRLNSGAAAESTFAEALERDPNSVGAQLGLAQALALQGEWARAIQFLESKRAGSPSLDLDHALARAYAACPNPALRQPAKAMRMARSLQRPGAAPQHHAAMAMVAAAGGFFPQAQQLQRRALAGAQTLGRVDLSDRMLEELELYSNQQLPKSPWSPAVFSSKLLLPIDDGRSIEEILEDLHRDGNSSRNPYLNDRRVAELTRQMEKASGAQFFSLQFERAWEQLRAGDTDEALSEIASLVKTFEENGIADDSDDMRRLLDLYALAYLRLGEQENCVNHAGQDACLLPFRGAAIHRQREGSEGAIRILTRLLENQPEHLGYRWLLNIAWMTLDGWPDQVPQQWRLPANAFDSEYALPRFYNVAAASGANVDGLAGGVSMDDFDGDSDLDLFVTSWGLDDNAQLLINDGKGSFEVKELSGQTGGLNTIHADYDNDGDVDLFVLRGAWLSRDGRQPNSLLRNDGRGNFTDVTKEAGLFRLAPTQTAAWLDFDLDGDLDLFVGNESTKGQPHASELYRNNGDGSFTEVGALAGIGILGFVKGVTVGDYDNDGWPDIYLSRYLESNRLLQNVAGPGGQRRFVDVTKQAGVNEPEYSFPTWFFDYDNDGDLDLYVASFADFWGDSLGQVVGDYLGQSTGSRSRLYRNNGDGSFTDIAPELGVNDVLLAMGANFGDLDNDGGLDLYIGTGQPNMSALVPNRMYRHGGTSYQDVTSSGGFGHLQKGHGIAFGDLDQDGDQDIYAVMGGAFRGDRFQNALFLNPGSDHSWVTLKLEGRSANRSAIGARIAVEVETPRGVRTFHRVVGTGGSFGASSLQQEIGLGDATKIREVRVSWPTKARKIERFQNISLNDFHRLIEGSEEPQ